MRYLLFLPAILSPAVAAIVNTGTLTTTFVAPPFGPSVEEETSITVDLSDLSGLTSGNDIIITFTTGGILYWNGQVNAGEGDLTLNYQARLTLTAGAFSVQSSETWSFGPASWVGGTFSGYDFGPVPGSFFLAVPWGTDLSNISFSLTDVTSVSGVIAALDMSSMELSEGTLTTTSSAVPEPASFLLFATTLVPWIRRRRSGSGLI